MINFVLLKVSKRAWGKHSVSVFNMICITRVKRLSVNEITPKENFLAKITKGKGLT